MRRTLATAAALVFLGLPNVAAATTQGAYDFCDPTGGACASHGVALRQAGLEVVMNAWALRGPDPEAYAASMAPIRVIWPLNALPRSQALALVPRLAAIPNTWGYYLADEPKPSEHDDLAAFARNVRNADPSHGRLIVACGLCGDDGAWLNDVDAAIGTDTYPVTDGYSPQYDYEAVTSTLGARFAYAPEGRRVAVLQSWSWGDSKIDAANLGIDPGRLRFPAPEELTAMRDAATDAAADLILWFTLTQTYGWVTGQRPDNWAQPGPERWGAFVAGITAPSGSWRTAPTPSLAPAGSPSTGRLPPRFTLRRLKLGRYRAAGNQLATWRVNGRKRARAVSVTLSLRRHRHSCVTMTAASGVARRCRFVR